MTAHTPGPACGQCDELRAERDRLRDMIEANDGHDALLQVARAALQDTKP